MSDLSNLKKLTIIIFTYNRHKYLKRTIKYWLSYDVKLVVLDGSDVIFKDPCLHKINIKYIHDKRGFHKRLLSSINFIETEFVILAGDDEFYLPSALNSCIKFLTKETTFSSCGGRAIGFGYYKDKLYGNEAYPKAKDRCLDQDNIVERVHNHFSVYVPSHFYSVIRSEKYKKICKHVFDKEFSVYAGFELQLEFLVVVSGKSRIIPELMWMRNRETTEISYGMPQIRINKWWFDKNYHDEKVEFLYRTKKACDELLAEQNIKFQKSKIEMFFEIYINQHIFKKNFLKMIINFIQLQNRKLIKFILGRDKIKFNSLIDQAKVLERQNIIVNYKELSKITLILQNSKDKN